MYVSELSLFQFRNYDEADFVFSDGINCFSGKNGAGKTNVLDAVHYLCLTRSYFHAQDAPNKKQGAETMVIRGVLNRSGSPDTIICGIQEGGRKVVKCNGKEYSRMAAHIGRFPVVMIVPSQINLIYDGSDERRRLMDMAISQTNKSYLDDLIRYNRALDQRNKQLKQFDRERFFDRELLLIWEKVLVETGQRIATARNEYIGFVSDVFRQRYADISNGAEVAEITYHTELLSHSLADLMEQNLEKDRILQRTGSGIHKDDLLFTLNGQPLKRYGSQGQQKSFIVAMKLAEYEFLASKTGVKPLLLLDDIFEKIDSYRSTSLLKMLDKNKFGQVFITDTDADRLARALQDTPTDKRFFLIDGGKVVILKK
jgi:DNA replication and repair protein RecF